MAYVICGTKKEAEQVRKVFAGATGYEPSVWVLDTGSHRVQDDRISPRAIGSLLRSAGLDHLAED